MLETPTQHRPCVVVPVFDHERALPVLIELLRQAHLPCWLVDDGSGRECATAIDELVAANFDWLRLERLHVNRGKGAAVVAGLLAAARGGYTHAVQIDADGQHDARDIAKFVAASRAAPEAVINGVAQYDASVPAVRLYGRMITNRLVWVWTLSRDIADSMCGFRVYPVAPMLQLERTRPIGRRMQFDTDSIVRLHWSGVPVVNLRTPVTYPADGVSHFNMVRDNLRMTALHLRLAAGMLRRLPRLVSRRLAASRAPQSDAV